MGLCRVRQTERLRPGRVAEKYLLREWDLCRFVWNQLVEKSQDCYLWNQVAVANGANPETVFTFGYKEQDKFLTRLRAQCVDPVTGECWLATGSSVAQQQTVRDFAAARNKALMDRKDRAMPVTRKKGMPRFKSKRVARPSMNYTRRGFSLVPAADQSDSRLRLRLPGGIDVPVVWTRVLPSNPKSVRVYRDNLGDWYASFVIEIDLAQHQLPAQDHGEAIGVDWGVTETATTNIVNTTTGDANDSTTYDLPHGGHGQKAAKSLARHQRAMARRRKPGNKAATKGYLKAKTRVAKTQKKIVRRRQDDTRKWAKNIVNNFDQIAVEDFKPKFLTKTTMARKAMDGAIAQAKTELIWQATKTGRDLRLVNPAHTTTDCFNCGARTKHRLPLEERTYHCEHCGTVRSRDKNSAAIMVVRAGFLPADIDGIRPKPAAKRNPAA